MSAENRMPVVFVGHGSPMNAVGRSRAGEGWRKMGETLGRPAVIVAISAHWATRGLYVRRAEDNPQIYDMYGFPDELYRIRYEPAGSAKTADRVLELLDGAASARNDWGIDHGVWTVLSRMYPDADVPVVLVSTDVTADAQTQYETGRRLRPLREEGVLILASGNVVHNLRLTDWRRKDGYSWADRFDRTVRDAIVRGDASVPVHYTNLEDWRLAVPTAEHYFPMLTALGAADAEDTATVWNDYRELGSLSMTSYLFSAPQRPL